MRKLSIFLAFILVLAVGQAFAQTCEVYISDMTNTWVDGSETKLLPNQTHVLTMNYSVMCSPADDLSYNPTNTFIVYTPDATADWNYLHGATLPAWDALGWNFVYVSHFEHDGSSWSKTPGTPISADAGSHLGDGLDSVAVFFSGVATGFPNGMLGLTDQAMVTLEFQNNGVDGTSLCLDSGIAGGAWLWAIVPPTAGDPIYPEFAAPNSTNTVSDRCWVVQEPPNFPPEIVPTTQNSFTLDHCADFEFTFPATDNEGDDIVGFDLVDVGTVDANIGSITDAGVYTLDAVDMLQSGSIDFVVRARDNYAPDHWSTNDFTVNITFSNQGPTIACPPGGTITAGLPVSQLFTASDDCDPISVTILNPGAGASEVGGEPTITSAGGNYYFNWTPQLGTPQIGVVFTLQVDDGLEQATCDVTFDVQVGSRYQIAIEKMGDVFQGHFVEVPILLFQAGSFGGFDLLFAYDASALSFTEAIENGGAGYSWDPVTDTYTEYAPSLYDECDWEYFTYRFGPEGNCGNGCPSGIVRVVGLAETNNGPSHPDPACEEAPVVSTLFKLKFLVSNDRTLNCQFVPIRFFWIDCGDNTVSDWDGELLFVAKRIFEFGDYGYYFNSLVSPTIQDNLYGFPGYVGPDTSCHAWPQDQWDSYVQDHPDAKPPLILNVDFQNGGVDIVCSDSIDAPGDVNVNGLAYEIADAVMFTQYFVISYAAFGNHQEASIAASDANQDGMPLTVADLVYLIRVIVGDAELYPKTAPFVSSYAAENGVLSVSDAMGAAFVVFEGEVEPTLLAKNMTMEYGYVNGMTRVLVYSTEANQTFDGQFLSANADVASIEFATYEGQPVTAKNVPTTFALNQNYPNPFNPTTTVEFALPTATDWTLTVYNVTGQVVESVNGHSDGGFVEYEFNASNLASGIYFYKVVAGDYTATKKMVLLK